MDELDVLPKMLPDLSSVRRSPGDQFSHDGKPFELRLENFWSWAYSNLVCNAQRGILAEYIVASAVKDDQNCRVEWDVFDARTSAGVTIEVKSAAYIQS